MYYVLLVQFHIVYSISILQIFGVFILYYIARTKQIPFTFLNDKVRTHIIINIEVQIIDIILLITLYCSSVKDVLFYVGLSSDIVMHLIQMCWIGKSRDSLNLLTRYETIDEGLKEVFIFYHIITPIYMMLISSLLMAYL